MQEAEYIQFTWFSNEFVNLDIAQIYRNLVGADAKTIHRPNKISLALPFLCQANGSSDGLNYLVQFDFQRLEFIVRKTDDGNSEPIGSLIDVSSNLNNLIEKVADLKFSNVNNISRLSLVVNLCKISDDINTIKNKYLELCPLNVLNYSTSDWFFRFNRTKNINDYCDINRITSYVITTYEKASVNETETENSINKYYALNVQLDYNTVPDRVLEFGIQKEIWREFATEICRLAENPNVKNMEMGN